MLSKRITTLLTTLCVAVAIIAAGCESQPKTRTTSTTTTQKPAAKQAPAKKTTSGWPTQRGGDLEWTSVAYPTHNPKTSTIGLEKGFPLEVLINRPFEYKIVVTNLTNGPLPNVVVRDEVEQLVVMNATPPSQEQARGLHAWNLGTLGPKQSKTITVNARPSNEGSAGSCATVEHDFLLCSTVPVVAPKLELTKSGPASVLKCEEITYTFQVKNAGTGTLDQVKINDPLPAGMRTIDGKNAITFNVGALRGGQSKPYTAKVQVDKPGQFQNRATATGYGGISVTSNTVTTTVTQPVLRITKSCPGKTFIGRAIDYEMTVSNTGNGEARETVLEDVLPAGAEFVSASDGGRVAGGRVRWNLGTMQPRGSKTVSMRIMPGSAGTYKNTANARAFCADAVTATCSTVVSGIPAILLEVVDLEDPDEVGTTETYVITVTNQGSAPDTNIRIVCTLENNQQYDSSTGPTRGTARGQVITFDPYPNLPAKQKITYRLTVRNVRAGDVRFKVTMNSDQLTRPVEETEATRVYE